MDNWFYYSSIRSISLAISDVFTGIKIAKMGEDGKVLGKVDVPLKYGLKTKDFYFRNDYKLNPQFPMMGLSSTQMQYAQDRATQKMGRVYLDKKELATTDNKLLYILNPSPWDISYNLIIATKFVLEAEQILEQILPFFNPFLVIPVTIQEINFCYDCKVILGSVSEDKQDSIGEDEVRNIQWNIDLTCHGYLFRPVEKVGIVKSIIANYHNNDTQVAQQIITENSTETLENNFRS